MPNGSKGLTDFIITNMYGVGVTFVEVKIGRDRLSKEQEIFKEMIERQEKRSKGVVKYRIIEVNDKTNNLADVIQEIYGK